MFFCFEGVLYANVILPRVEVLPSKLETKRVSSYYFIMGAHTIGVSHVIAKKMIIDP